MVHLTFSISIIIILNDLISIDYKLISLIYFTIKEKREKRKKRKEQRKGKN
jgi:hypothetical protein